MITVVVGAPGSGKSTVAPLLGELLAGQIVLDWDAFMGAAGALAGREIRDSPGTWPAYRDLVRAVLRVTRPAPVVLLGVAGPADLEGWGVDAWLVLDCADGERRRRLEGDGRGDDVAAAVRDAGEYRALGVPVVDTTGLSPRTVAERLAALVRRTSAGSER